MTLRPVHPELVALDIDGTLFSNVPSHRRGRPRRSARRWSTAVNRAYDAGAHVVLATGRSTFGITHVWDMLGLPRDGAQRALGGQQRRR